MGVENEMSDYRGDEVQKDAGFSCRAMRSLEDVSCLASTRLWRFRDESQLDLARTHKKCVRVKKPELRGLSVFAYFLRIFSGSRTSKRCPWGLDI